MSLAFIVAAPFVLAGIGTDFRSLRLPLWVTVPLLFVAGWVSWEGYHRGCVEYPVGLILGGLVPGLFAGVSRGRKIGMGDVLLGAALGGIAGAPDILAILLGGSIMATAHAALSSKTRGIAPLGAYIGIAFFVVMAVGRHGVCAVL